MPANLKFLAIFMLPNTFVPRDCLAGASGSYPTQPRKQVNLHTPSAHHRSDHVYADAVTTAHDTDTSPSIHPVYDNGLESSGHWDLMLAWTDVASIDTQATDVLDDHVNLQVSFQDSHDLFQGVGSNHPGIDNPESCERLTRDNVVAVDEENLARLAAVPLEVPKYDEQTSARPCANKISPSYSSHSSSAILTPPDHTNSSPELAGSDSGGKVSGASILPEQLYNEAANQLGGPCSNTWQLPQWRTRKPKNVAMKREASERGHDKDNEQARRRPFEDAEQREMTALTRRIKACIRCRMQRKRCNLDQNDLFGPCLTCKGLDGPTRSKLNCFRYIITDASLYRQQNAPYKLFSKRWHNMNLVDIQDWASDEVKSITISQIFLEAPYEVNVREFIPQEGDMLEDQWYQNGQIRRYQIPRYALVDLAQTASMLERFIDSNIVVYIDGAVNDPLIWATYRMAFLHLGEAKTPKERDLILDTFRLWVACRKTSNPHHICGSDKLGAPTVKDSGSLFDNVVPMPVIMIAQMELIMYSRVLRPMSKRVRDSLQALVEERKPWFWYTIYLCCFMLLHSCAMQTKRDEETATQYKLNGRFANPNSIKAHHSGAQTILGHWHYVIKASQPFRKALTEDGLKEVQATAKLADAQAEFISKTAQAVGDERVFRRIRKCTEFGNDWYWISQLYDKDWVPGETA